MIHLARRNPALAAEDFPHAWREHSALGRQCLNVQDKVLGVTQCSRVLEPCELLPGFSTAYDGVNLMVLRDCKVASSIWDDEETRRIMRPDELRVLSTYVRSSALTCRETVLRSGPQTCACAIAFLRWRCEPPAAGEIATIAGSAARGRASRLIWNAVVDERPPGYAYDAVLECWFDSNTALIKAFAGRQPWATLGDALAGRIHPASSLCLRLHVTHRRP